MPTELVKPSTKHRSMDLWVSGRLIDWAAGLNGSEQTKEILRREIQAVATDLSGPSPSPIERTLAETAALAWFALRLHESQFVGGSCSEGGLTINQSDHHQRRVERANRRYLSTLKTLATVRRLAVPALQINLARQQVNIAGSTPLESLTDKGDG